MKSILPLLCLLGLNVACVPVLNSVVSPADSALNNDLSVSPAVEASPVASESSTLPESSSTTPEPTSPSSNTDTKAVDLSQIARIELDSPTRFLNNSGESLRLQVMFYDADGNGLSFNPLPPVRFISSRPQDIAVAEDGTITSLVGEGYSEVQVQLTVQQETLSARKLFSIVSPFSGSGSGSQANNVQTEEADVDDAFENISGDIDFQL